METKTLNQETDKTNKEISTNQIVADKVVEELKLEEKVVKVNRVAKVVKGGRRFSFTALVVVGDGQGMVGTGYGKAKEVSEAIRKGVEDAKKHLVKVCFKGFTIPYEIIGQHGASRVLLRPAPPGTGIRAGSSIRAVMEAAGYKDIVTKSLGSDNAINVVYATLNALTNMRDPNSINTLRSLK